MQIPQSDPHRARKAARRSPNVLVAVTASCAGLAAAIVKSTSTSEHVTASLGARQIPAALSLRTGRAKRRWRALRRQHRCRRTFLQKHHDGTLSVYPPGRSRQTSHESTRLLRLGRCRFFPRPAQPTPVGRDAPSRSWSSLPALQNRRQLGVGVLADQIARLR